MSEHILRTAKLVSARRAGLVSSIARTTPSEPTSRVQQILELVLTEFAMCLGLPDDDEPKDRP